MQKFKPTLFYKTIEEISAETLQAMGIRALILDIDNTLVPPHTPVCDARAKAFVARMQPLFQICIVSNNIYERAEKFAASFPVDFVCDGNKPSKKPFRLALEKLKVPPKTVAVVGDQIFTDVWGANRMGMCAVLVNPICAQEGWFVKVKRKLENVVYKRGQ